MQEKYQLRNIEVGADELVNKSLACLITGVSIRTLEDWTTKGKLPIYKLSPRTVRYRVRELIQWVNERAVSGKS